MGSVTSAFTRTRNALVKVGSQPENHDPERSQSAPESDRAKKRGARFHVSIQSGRQSSRTSLSEVLSRQDSGAKKRTSDGQHKDAVSRWQSPQWLPKVLDLPLPQRHGLRAKYMNESSPDLSAPQLSPDQ